MAKNLVLDAVRNDGLDALVVSPTFMIGPYDSRPSSGTMILKVVEKNSGIHAWRKKDLK